MLYTFAAVLILLWLIGAGSSYKLNGLIHIPLIIAFVLVLVQISASVA